MIVASLLFSVCSSGAEAGHSLLHSKPQSSASEDVSDCSSSGAEAGHSLLQSKHSMKSASPWDFSISDYLESATWKSATDARIASAFGEQNLSGAAKQESSS